MHADSDHSPTPQISSSEALRRLIDGNRRFLAGQPRHPQRGPEVLADLVQQQRPFATILGCSDSRVPPELLFDAGLGQLFVIRVAGNVLSAEVAASLQYAGSHLHTPLFVVLGHDHCGAIQAALQTKRENVQHRSRIQMLVASILPALDAVDQCLSPEAQLAQAVESNVRWTVRQICDSPEGQARLAEGRMMIVGAIYELGCGRVRFLDDRQISD